MTPGREGLQWKRTALVWLALVALALSNLALAYAPLHGLHLPLALLIAAIMVLLVAIFLMDLRLQSGQDRMAAAVGFLWVAIMFGLTFADILSR